MDAAPKPELSGPLGRRDRSLEAGNCDSVCPCRSQNGVPGGGDGVTFELMNREEPDRLDWIFDGEVGASLEERYDRWAATYDTDHDQWGWRGPDMVATAALRHIGVHESTDTIIDAGCGTGKAGIALRTAGWRGPLVGLDLSQGMLEQADSSGVYDELIRCSLADVPLPDGVTAAVVSSGVFTHGHVGGEAFAELCRITRPGGVISVTQRLDLLAFFEPHDQALRQAARWEQIERSAPELLHPERDDTEQTVITWRVLPRS